MVSKPDSHEYSIASEKEAFEAADAFCKRYNEFDNGVERLDEETEFIKNLASAVDDDDITNDVSNRVINELKNRTSLRQRDLENRLEDLSNSDSERLPLNEWLELNVDSVTMEISDDNNIDTTFKWEFVSGDTTETTGQHYNWLDFSEILNQTNPLFAFAEPDESYLGGKEWKVDFMMDFLRRRAKTVEIEGSRTHALEDLQNTIISRTASDSVDDAYAGSGIYVEEPDADDIYVISRLIMNVAEEQSENARSLQSEMDSRGIVNGKVSEILQLDSGQTARFWKLPRDFAEPKIPDSLFSDEDDESNDGVSATRSDAL